MNRQQKIVWRWGIRDHPRDLGRATGIHTRSSFISNLCLRYYQNSIVWGKQISALCWWYYTEELAALRISISMLMQSRTAWVNENHLCFSTTRCKYMLISQKKRPRPMHPPAILINGCSYGRFCHDTEPHAFEIHLTAPLLELHNLTQNDTFLSSQYILSRC